MAAGPPEGIPAADAFVRMVGEKLQSQDVYLLYAAKSKECNHVIVLRDWHTLRLNRDKTLFRSFVRSSPYLYIGEHGIAEKLKLSNMVMLTKEQRQWISEPARGSVMVTKEARYMLRP